MNTLHIPCETGQISDGYHTFDELYEHRCTLFVALMAAHPALAWMSAQHDDGTMFPGWFICGMNLPTGCVSYHLPVSMMGLAQHSGAAVLPRSPKWDGHTAADVVKRVQAFVRSNPEISGVSSAERKS